MSPADTVVEAAKDGSGFGWAEGATVLAAAIAALIAVVGYTIQRKIARRTERADLYGQAIGAIEAYLEGPYRIRRKINDPENWFAISNALSDTKTTISHHIALLEMHAPKDVQTAYRAFETAALREAGPQMTAAWHMPPVTTYTAIPLGTGYPRGDANTAREALVAAMAADLERIGTWWRLSS